MKNKRKTLFISDLHLEAGRPDITQQFLQFLNSCPFHSVDAIYILGDLFEVWIGDDDHNLFHQEIIEGLRAITQQGIPIYFMFGNRDFLIGKKFLRETGCQLLADEEKINLYGTSVLLMHGDTLCTDDINYIKARKNARNIFLQKLFLMLPLRFRKSIADKMRAKSLRHTQSTALAIMDVTQKEVMRVMQKHEVNVLIHGHTHRPDIHHFPLAQSQGTRIVLGAWHHVGNMLVWDETGEKGLVDVPNFILGAC